MKLINLKTMTTTLREEYTELLGKRPFNGWSEEQLRGKMEEYRKENHIVEDTEEVAPVIPTEADIVKGHTTRHEQIQSLKRQKMMKGLLNLAPVTLDGKLFAIVDNDYVPFHEAEIIMLKKLKVEIDLLIEEKLTLN